MLILGETGSGKEVVVPGYSQTISYRAGRFYALIAEQSPRNWSIPSCLAMKPAASPGPQDCERDGLSGPIKARFFSMNVANCRWPGKRGLLRILQDGTFERVGGEKQLQVDVRGRSDASQFAKRWSARERSAKIFGIASPSRCFHWKPPPLRDWPEDIPALAGHFALRASKRFGLPPCAPTPEDVNLLAAYPLAGERAASWPR